MNKDDYKVPPRIIESIPPENELFSSSIRLTIMIILNSTKFVGFTDLMRLLKLTSSKLDHHLKVLENQSLISRKRLFLPKRPLIYLSMTEKGKKTFKIYVNDLKKALEKIE